MTEKRPPVSSNSNPSIKAFSRFASSSFTAIRSAWKTRVAGCIFPRRAGAGTALETISASSPVLCMGVSFLRRVIAAAIRRELDPDRLRHGLQLRLVQAGHPGADAGGRRRGGRALDPVPPRRRPSDADRLGSGDGRAGSRRALPDGRPPTGSQDLALAPRTLRPVLKELCGRSGVGKIDNLFAIRAKLNKTP